MRRVIFTMLAWFGVASFVLAVEPIALPVVRTWGELQKAPRLTVHPASGVKPAEIASELAAFQVGISSDRTTTCGAVVLYFLGSTGSIHPYVPEDWGDYWLRIDGQVWAGGTNWLTYQKVPGEKVPDGTLFYARTLTFIKAGDHIVELIKPPDGVSKWTPSDVDRWIIAADTPGSAMVHPPTVLARATIHVAGEPQSLWYPFWTISDFSGGAYSDRDANGDQIAIEQINNPKGCASLPGTPRPRWYVKFPPPDFLLPSLIPPEPPGAQVALKMTDSTLDVTFDSQIEGFFPDDYFLTRWWVNGKPAELDRNANRHGQMRALGIYEPRARLLAAAYLPWKRLPSLALGAQIWYTHEVHFGLTFKPEWLGAKKGDRVGVQILFCPSGYVTFTSAQQMMINEPDIARPLLPPSSFSESSNKIEFIYSGDPVHPQQP